MTVTLFLILLVVGAAVGYYSGLVGTGGNLILIPAFDLLFHYLKVPENEVVKFMLAHSFFITTFTGLNVSYKQFKVKNIYVKEVLFISLPGMITAFILTELIRKGNWYHKSDFDVVFFSLLLFLAGRMLLYKPHESTATTENRRLYYFPLIGVVAGIISSFSGIGGGIIVIPILTDIIKIPFKKASSISIGVVAMLAIPITASYLMIDSHSSFQHILPVQLGYISLTISAPILIGVFSTSGLGVRKAQTTAPHKLRLILGLVILILSAKMVYGFFKIKPMILQ